MKKNNSVSSVYYFIPFLHIGDGTIKPLLPFLQHVCWHEIKNVKNKTNCLKYSLPDATCYQIVYHVQLYCSQT